MAHDIVPIELGLSQGDVVTLWAPQWTEEGEDWEAFLGDEDSLFAFPDAVHLAAFVRAEDEHDLIDHPSWSTVPRLTVAELEPEESRYYDVVGVPELLAEEPDRWAVEELGETIGMVESLSEVCDLDVVGEVLSAAPGFSALKQGSLAFSGREGRKLWNSMAKVVAKRWDEVLDALEESIDTPEVDDDQLALAEQEQAEHLGAEEDDDAAADADVEESGDEQKAGVATGAGASPDDTPATEAPSADDFWAEVGIDPVEIITTQGRMYTLRCYLDDAPIFLGKSGRVLVFGAPRALGRYLAEPDSDLDLAEVSTWEEVLSAATGGDLEVDVDPSNTYVLTGLADDLAEGPEVVDAEQLELAVELITDVAEWANDDATRQALLPSEPLGWLVSYIIDPSRQRLAPEPPFDAEVESWQRLVATCEDRLRQR